MSLGSLNYIPPGSLGKVTSSKYYSKISRSQPMWLFDLIGYQSTKHTWLPETRSCSSRCRAGVWWMLWVIHSSAPCWVYKKWGKVSKLLLNAKKCKMSALLLQRLVSTTHVPGSAKCILILYNFSNESGENLKISKISKETWVWKFSSFFLHPFSYIFYISVWRVSLMQPFPDDSVTVFHS